MTGINTVFIVLNETFGLLEFLLMRSEKYLIFSCLMIFNHAVLIMQCRVKTAACLSFNFPLCVCSERHS